MLPLLLSPRACIVPSACSSRAGRRGICDDQIREDNAGWYNTAIPCVQSGLVPAIAISRDADAVLGTISSSEQWLKMQAGGTPQMSIP